MLEALRDPTAATVLGVLALVVSIVSVVTTWRAGRRTSGLQERLVALETARERDRLKAAGRAKLVGVIRPVKNSARLVVSNTGSVTARNVRVLMDGQPADEHPIVMRDDTVLSSLGPAATFEFVLVTMKARKPVVTVRLEWGDGTSEGGTWESDLKLS